MEGGGGRSAIATLERTLLFNIIPSFPVLILSYVLSVDVDCSSANLVCGMSYVWFS